MALPLCLVGHIQKDETEKCGSFLALASSSVIKPQHYLPL
jgi:hypothetical protein